MKNGKALLFAIVFSSIVSVLCAIHHFLWVTNTNLPDVWMNPEPVVYLVLTTSICFLITTGIFYVAFVSLKKGNILFFSIVLSSFVSFFVETILFRDIVVKYRPDQWAGPYAFAFLIYISGFLFLILTPVIHHILVYLKKRKSKNQTSHWIWKLYNRHNLSTLFLWFVGSILLALAFGRWLYTIILGCFVLLYGLSFYCCYHLKKEK